MDPDVHFVSLLGPAGTGKTFLALAAGFAQVFDQNVYTEIFATRAPVPVGEEIGFFPGTEEEKMTPWMGAIKDNVEELTELHNPSANRKAIDEANRQLTDAFVRNRIKIKSMTTMRGRTLRQRFIILDEAQNLTPKQMQTLITRAGHDTKIVCLGNLKQIDTPYLTETSSGLAHVVERFRGWYRSGHVTLEVIERSELAEYAEKNL
jgi:PhoH-like ATPase